MTKAQGDRLLRQDLMKMYRLFDGYGKDQMLLAVLEYNVGPYAILGTSKGFYLTPDILTATRMAQKKARLFGGTATLITYEMDDTAPRSDLKVKVFPEKASVEWLVFVDANRSHIHDYDIVI